MRLFQHRPIKHSLMLIGMLTNGVAVVVLSLALGVGEWLSYRDRAVTSVHTYASVVGGSLVPALLFEDAKAAQEVLDRLAAIDPSITEAILADHAARPVARYQIAKEALPASLPLPGEHLFASGHLTLAYAIDTREGRLGVLYLHADLGSLYRSMLGKLALIFFAMAASLIFANVLFARLQKAISDPLQDLAGAIRQVTRDADYTTRVSLDHGNELGALAGGFNTMLGVIREREEALMEHRANLEQTVAQRTEELRQINASLEQRIAEETAKSRAKDHLLIQQSRLATLGEMIGNIAHQWRQPLNALSLLFANLQDAQRYGELDQAYVDTAGAKANGLITRMSATIDDFRNLFKPDRERSRFCVASAVREALSVIEASFRNSNITVTLEAEETLCAEGFPNQYVHVLLNILGNARDAIRHSGRGDGWVSVSVWREGADAVVTISDNGGGIPANVIDKIFDPYFTTREKGTGIGLYMSVMIIEQNMNGSIRAANRNSGAEFRVAIPLHAGEAPT